ncbi:hypothetical protein [Tropicimonas marinistellae]|nr:hypothetical protein [Tropicimonas marinistellae]
MKAMLAGFAAAIVIAFGAWYALNHVGFSSQETYSGPNVRLE